MRFHLTAFAAALALVSPAAAQSIPRMTAIERVSAGVVSVRAETTELAPPPALGGDLESFNDFFDDIRKRPQNGGQGTGFLLDGAGHIVTASFVVEGAHSIFIGLPSGEERPASIVAIDESSMIAVLKADPAGLSPLAFSRATPRQGAEAYAVAHAFGIPAALATTGMVAGVDIPFPGDGQRFLVLDMRINLGNAGAPVTDAAGDVIGMATAVYGSGGAVGSLGIAVPAKVVEEIAGRLIRDGRIPRSAIGAILAPPAQRGEGAALVLSVEKGSPAERAGFKSGDIIVKADGVELSDNAALRRYIAARPVGSKVSLSYRRQGALREAAVVTVEGR